MKEILNAGEILSITAEDRASKPVALVRNLPMPDGIDTCDGRMYWTNMGVPSENDGTVLSAKLDGSDLKTVIPAGQVHTPKQLHIDQTARNCTSATAKASESCDPISTVPSTRL